MDVAAYAASPTCEHLVSVGAKLGAAIVVARVSRSGIVSQNPAAVARQQTILGFLLNTAGRVTGWGCTRVNSACVVGWIARTIRCICCRNCGKRQRARQKEKLH